MNHHEKQRNLDSCVEACGDFKNQHQLGESSTPTPPSSWEQRWQDEFGCETKEYMGRYWDGQKLHIKAFISQEITRAREEVETKYQKVINSGVLCPWEDCPRVRYHECEYHGSALTPSAEGED